MKAVLQFSEQLSANSYIMCLRSVIFTAIEWVVVWLAVRVGKQLTYGLSAFTCKLNQSLNYCLICNIMQVRT